MIGYHASSDPSNRLGLQNLTTITHNARQRLLYRTGRDDRIGRRNPIRSNWLSLPMRWYHIRSYPSRHGATAFIWPRVQNGSTRLALLLRSSLRHHERSHCALRGSTADNIRGDPECRHFHPTSKRARCILTERFRRFLGE